MDLCAHRVVLFDNKTNDAVCQHEQLKKLFDTMDSVISNTGGIPFSNQMFRKIKVVKLYCAFLNFFSVTICIYMFCCCRKYMKGRKRLM